MFTKSTKALALSTFIVFSAFGGTNLTANNKQKKEIPEFNFTFDLLPKEPVSRMTIVLGSLFSGCLCVDLGHSTKECIKSEAKISRWQKRLFKNPTRGFLSGLIGGFSVLLIAYNCFENEINYDYYKYKVKRYKEKYTSNTK